MRDFYRSVLGRNSIDGKGLRLDGYVHRGTGFQDAFWDGQEMVFGDGDGKIFIDFTGALDVIGHELTHGVTQYAAGLEYHDQSGALNESVSDVFGSLVKQWHAGQTADQADWLIGDGIFGPAMPPPLSLVKMMMVSRAMPPSSRACATRPTCSSIAAIMRR